MAERIIENLAKEEHDFIEFLFGDGLLIDDGTLKLAEKELKKELNGLKKKAEKAATAKAKKVAKEKAEKELLKAINKSGLSMDDVKAKLGI